MPFGRERVVSCIIAKFSNVQKKKHNQKTDIQIQVLSDHIKKSNRRTYFSFAINLITNVSSNREDEFRKFPRAFWSEEGGFVHNSKNFEYPKN